MLSRKGNGALDHCKIANIIPNCSWLALGLMESGVGDGGVYFAVEVAADHLFENRARSGQQVEGALRPRGPHQLGVSGD